MDQPVPFPKVLVAPLDWGLGHATRCIPIIRQLLTANCTVLIATDEPVKTLLQAEFPQVQFIKLTGYKIKYSRTTYCMPFKIVAQIPRLLLSVVNEQSWLVKVVEKEKIDIVISDSRFGLYHSKVLTVFITHQLAIKAPGKFLELLLRKANYYFVSRFKECWIPDAGGVDSLAGSLSHPAVKPKTALRYIGALSRFKKNSIEKETHLLIILSGPEPQRTILEKKLVQDLKTYKEPVVFVRGLPQGSTSIATGNNVIVYAHLHSAILQQKINAASFIISRCGYSTVMDIAATGKKGILIPTPGQTEQEYLAKHLMKNNFALCISQKTFRMQHALSLAAEFPFKPYNFSNTSPLPQAIDQLIFSVKTHMRG